MAQANTHFKDDPIAQRIEAESRERHARKVDAFNRLFHEWLRLNAEERVPDGLPDEAADALRDRIDELARQVCSTPATLGYHILDKVRVLEDCIGADDGEWLDKRHVMMLGGIKADLLHFDLVNPEIGK